MSQKHALLAGLITIIILGAAACQAPPVRPGKSVVVTYSILGSVVKELAGDQATVTVAIPNGLDPHEWEPSARDIETINRADLVIENGLGLEEGLTRTLRAARDKGVKFFTAADYIAVRRVGPGEGIPSGDPDQALGAPDPHLWTDPLAVKDMVGALARQLKPDLNLDAGERASNLESRLDALNKEIAGMVAAISPENRQLVTGHESLGYFAQRYGFKLAGVIIPGLSSQAGVSAADLAALKKAIEDNHVKAIFTELGTSPAVARAIGEETGVRVVPLTTHALPADGSYFTFLRNMAKVITDALK